MPDLDIELRRLATAMIREAPEAPNFDAVTATPVRPTGPSHVPRRTAAFAIGAIALVVIAIVIAVLAAPDDTEQQPAGPTRFVPCTQKDPGAFIGTNGKRFGPIVNNHPDGGTVTGADIAAMPDYIPVTCQTGDTIGGWIMKADMLDSATPISPELAPDAPPDVDPVYADDGTTVVGHMVDGKGFVPLDQRSSAASQPTFETIELSDGTPGACVRAMYSGGNAETCLAVPGASIWRVQDIDYVLSRGPLDLTDGTTIPTNAGPLTVVPASEVAPRVRGLENCYSTKLADAVAATLPRASAAYYIGGCSPTFAFVGPEGKESRSEPTLWFGRGAGGEWSFMASVDFSNPDRSERCSALSDESPAGPGSSARFNCMLLG